MNTIKANDPRTVFIHTDGACSGNPGPGGWGCILQRGPKIKELSGGEQNTTNNRMELTAVIKALEALKRPVPVIITTDSRYVLDGLTKWLPEWKTKGWKTAKNKPVKNIDLWKRLDELCQGHEIEWQWVRGHSGHEGNERADELARTGMG